MATRSAPAIPLSPNDPTNKDDNHASATNNPVDTATGFDGKTDKSMSQRRELSISRRLLPDTFTYSWQNLSVESKLKKRRWKCWKEHPFRVEIKQIPILRSLSGAFKSGELWALMGASGAGKTTLLNSLNFRNEHHVQVTGTRSINGVPIGPDNITAVSGYLQQDDLLPDALTCREHLSFTATLRLPSTMSSKRRRARVDEVLHDVGLWHVRNVFIGGVFSKGLSGGEKKRLAFASEILTDPSILFCDEPTSGLDSFMATIVVDIMKKMASRGKLVICTIHQPSTDVFKSFDHLYLLSEGRLAYAGPRLDALKFFSNVGYECPASHNPADFYVQTMAIIPDEAEECRRKTAEVTLAFARSEQYQAIKEEIRQLEKGAYHAEALIREMKNPRKYASNWFVQFGALFQRCMRIYVRDLSFGFTHMFSEGFLGIFIAVSAKDTQLDLLGVGTITGLIMMSMFIQLCATIYFVITDVPKQIPLLMREHWDGLYALIPFYLARALMEMIFFSIFPFIYFLPIYFLVDLMGPIERLGWNMVTMILTSNAGGALGTAIASISPNVQMAIAIAVIVVCPIAMMNGFYADEDSLMPPLCYFKYLSVNFLGAENMMTTQWEDVTGIEGSLSTGEDVLLFYKYKEHYWRNTGLMVIITVFFRILACVLLVLRGRR